MAASVLLHLVGIAVFVLGAALQPPESPDEPDDEQTKPEEVSEEDFEVALVREPKPKEKQKVVKKKRQPKPKDEPKKPKPKPKEKKKEHKQQETARKPPRQQPERLKRKAVDQKTNQKDPTEANFLSDENNRVEEEMVARKTTNKNVDPTDTQGEAADEKSKERQKEKGNPDEPEETSAGEKVAGRATRPDRRPTRPRKRPPTPPKPPDQKEEEPPEERPKETDEEAPERPRRPSDDPDKPRPTEPTEREKVPKRKAPDEPLPMPKVSDYDRVFDGSEDRQKADEVQKQQSKGAGHAMYERMEKSKGSVKATLENYVTEVKPGNHTALNARESVGASYIARIHREIHPLWGGQYLPRLDGRYGPNHPLSNPNLKTVLEFVIDGSSGELKSVNIVDSSGQTQYDMEAVRVSKMVAPHPKPPEKIVSPDGNVYMHWRFWRNQRQCGTFGVSLYRVEGRKGGKGGESGDEKAEKESGKAGERDSR